jgi:hypothetical protein
MYQCVPSFYSCYQPSKARVIVLPHHGKPPIKFKGHELMNEYGEQMGAVLLGSLEKNTVADETVAWWVTESGVLICQHLKNKIVDCDEEGLVCDSTSRVRPMHSLEDVWTFFSKQSQRWIDSLANVGALLGDETLFWIKVS